MRGYLALLSLAVATGGAGAQLPKSSLAVETASGWQTWWRSESAPSRWSSPSPVVMGAARWRSLGSGIEETEIRLSGTGEAWRLRAVLVRFDPSHVRPDLVRMTRDEGTLGAWTVDSASPQALIALNAGQFASGRPWGWIVRNGVEEQPPGFGPLSLALVADSSGAMKLIAADSIAVVRGRARFAFQSYPTLLDNDGEVPMPLRTPDRGADVEHRDSRLAIGQLRDGRMLIVLTRFEGLGGILSELPFGPTAPEMSALMGALGCTRAVALDGGISGQLMVKGAGAWRGMRRVPMGLVLFAR